MAIIVHYLNNSRAQRILWLLEELEVPYEVKRYERVNMLASPEFFKVHPLGKSPVIGDGDLTIAESEAIVEYVIAKYGDGRLQPSESSWLENIYFSHYAEGTLMPLLVWRLILTMTPGRVPFFVRLFARRICNALIERMVDKRLVENTSFIEEQLKKCPGGWFAGRREPTVADFMMSFPIEIFASHTHKPVPESFDAYLKMIHDRPAYKRALEKGGSYAMASHPPMYVVEARVTSFNPPQPPQPATTKSRGKKAKAAPPPPDAWPHPSTFKANPSTLAQAGFFYPDRNDPNASGIVDEVECFMCGHTLGGWEEQDDPHYEHAKRVKQTKCSWALAVCSIQSERVGKDTWRFMASDRLPTARALERARRGTFGTYWPHDQAGSKHGITSKKVAEAGFVYTPTASSPDMATCPYCQTAFADWEMDDVPLALHQKKRPNCPIFTGKVFDPNETMDGPDEVDFLTPVAPTTTSRKASTQKGSSRKPSSAALNQSQRAPATVSRQPNAEPGASTKGKRLTRAASTAKPNVIDEASEPEAESEVIPPAPAKPTKKATRGKSSVVPSANPLAKSTRSKKVAAVPTPPEVKEEEEDEPMEASDFEAAPAPPPKFSGHGRSRTQAQGQIQRQAPSRDASRPQPEEDENAAGPSRGASNRSQSVQKASGGAVKGSRHPSGQAPDNVAEVNGAKVSRKKQAPRPPSPVEDEEMEEPEPEPVAKPSKKIKANAKKATKKAEPVVEDDFDTLPPPAPEPPSKDKLKPGKKASPPEVVVPSRKIESLEKPPASAKSKEMNKVPFPTIATPEPEVEAEPEPEEVAPPKAKTKKGGKNTAKSKKATTKATKKAKTPEPEPPSPEANEMEVDDIVESASNQVTEPELEPDSEPVTEGEDLSGTEASAPTEQSEAEEPGMMEEDRPNLPLVDSGAINKATGTIQASVIAPVKGKVNGIIPLERAKSPQRTPKANPLSNVQQQTTPKPAVQDIPDVRMASPELAPPPPEVAFTAEERKMTLIEYVRKQMQEAYEHLKADGERELQSFDERAEEVRRQLDSL